jgi:hypothetical protein
MGHKKGALAALLIVFFSVLLAWLGGYNFDYRNWVVALWTVATIYEIYIRDKGIRINKDLIEHIDVHTIHALERQIEDILE